MVVDKKVMRQSNASIPLRVSDFERERDRGGDRRRYRHMTLEKGVLATSLFLKFFPGENTLVKIY